MESKTIWISWQNHQRTKNLCNYLDCQLFTLINRSPSLIRYFVLSIKTIKIIHANRPGVLIVQNPSIVLSLLACLLRYLYKYTLIVDAHNAGVCPENKYLVKLSFLLKFIITKSDLTIVTNDNLASIIKSYGGKPYVLPDKLPSFECLTSDSENDFYDIVLICTFGVDEPYEEFLKSFSCVDRNVRYFVTGKLTNIDKIVYDKYCNSVEFTDYLPDMDYVELLSKSDVLVDLTTREDCLVCGAYEAVSLCKPLILSDTKALKKYFNRGVVYTQNSYIDIAKSVVYSIDNINILMAEMKTLKEQLSITWQSQGEGLKNYITAL